MTPETNEARRAGESGATSAAPEPAFPSPGEQSVEEEQTLLTAEALADRAPTDARDAAGARAPAESVAGGGRRIVASAAIIAVGQLLSSVLGFVRITALNVFFEGAASGAFLTALKPTQQINDLLIGSSVSGALIPTFVDYSAGERRDELSRIYSTLLNIVALLMALAAGVLFVFAPLIARFYTPGYSASAQSETVALIRIVGFSLIGLGLYAASSGLLYALRDVVFPAFATGVYHVGVVLAGVGALLLAAGALGVPFAAMLHPDASAPLIQQAQYIGARGLAAGAVLGTLGQFLILVPALRRAGVRWRPVLDLGHPAIRQILRLYAPIVAGLLIAVLYQSLDIHLANQMPGDDPRNPTNYTALQSGTALTQFPVGLVASALSFAVLPALTAAASRADLDGFKRTLRMGFRLGLLLMVPAAVGLFVLREPIVQLIFQHGRCGAGCTVKNALAIQNYAYELPFIVVDQLLIAAFYARKNTLIPNILGVASIAFYLAVALPFSGTIGLPALAFADTAKNSGHAIALFLLLTLVIGDLGMRDLTLGVGRILLAGLAMALVAWGVALALAHVAPGGTTASAALQLAGAGALASLVYFAVARLLGVEELRLVGSIVRSRLGGRAR